MSSNMDGNVNFERFIDGLYFLNMPQECIELFIISFQTQLINISEALLKLRHNLIKVNQAESENSISTETKTSYHSDPPPIEEYFMNSETYKNNLNYVKK